MRQCNLVKGKRGSTYLIIKMHILCDCLDFKYGLHKKPIKNQSIKYFTCLLLNLVHFHYHPQTEISLASLYQPLV